MILQCSACRRLAFLGRGTETPYVVHAIPQLLRQIIGTVSEKAVAGQLLDLPGERSGTRWRKEAERVRGWLQKEPKQAAAAG